MSITTLPSTREIHNLLLSASTLLEIFCKTIPNFKFIDYHRDIQEFLEERNIKGLNM